MCEKVLREGRAGEQERKLGILQLEKSKKPRKSTKVMGER